MSKYKKSSAPTRIENMISKLPDIIFAVCVIITFVSVTFGLCMYLNIRHLTWGDKPVKEINVTDDVNTQSRSKFRNVEEPISTVVIEKSEVLPFNFSIGHPHKSPSTEDKMDINLGLMQLVYSTNHDKKSAVDTERIVHTAIRHVLRRKSFRYLGSLYAVMAKKTVAADLLGDKSSSKWAVRAYTPVRWDKRSALFHLVPDSKCEVTRIEFVSELVCKNQILEDCDVVIKVNGGEPMRRVKGIANVKKTAVYDLTITALPLLKGTTYVMSPTEIQTPHHSVETFDPAEVDGASSDVAGFNVTVDGIDRPAAELDESMVIVYCNIPMDSGGKRSDVIKNDRGHQGPVNPFTDEVSLFGNLIQRVSDSKRNGAVKRPGNKDDATGGKERQNRMPLFGILDKGEASFERAPWDRPPRPKSRRGTPSGVSRHTESSGDPWQDSLGIKDKSPWMKTSASTTKTETQSILNHRRIKRDAKVKMKNHNEDNGGKGSHVIKNDRGHQGLVNPLTDEVSLFGNFKQRLSDSKRKSAVKRPGNKDDATGGKERQNRMPFVSDSEAEPLFGIMNKGQASPFERTPWDRPPRPKPRRGTPSGVSRHTESSGDPWQDSLGIKDKSPWMKTSASTTKTEMQSNLNHRRIKRDAKVKMKNHNEDSGGKGSHVIKNDRGHQGPVNPLTDEVTSFGNFIQRLSDSKRKSAVKRSGNKDDATGGKERQNRMLSFSDSEAAPLFGIMNKGQASPFERTPWDRPPRPKPRRGTPSGVSRHTESSGDPWQDSLGIKDKSPWMKTSASTTKTETQSNLNHRRIKRDAKVKMKNHNEDSGGKRSDVIKNDRGHQGPVNPLTDEVTSFGNFIQRLSDSKRKSAVKRPGNKDDATGGKERQNRMLSFSDSEAEPLFGIMNKGQASPFERTPLDRPPRPKPRRGTPSGVSRHTESSGDQWQDSLGIKDKSPWMKTSASTTKTETQSNLNHRRIKRDAKVKMKNHNEDSRERHGRGARTEKPRKARILEMFRDVNMASDVDKKDLSLKFRQYLIQSGSRMSLSKTMGDSAREGPSSSSPSSPSSRSSSSSSLSSHSDGEYDIQHLNRRSRRDVMSKRECYRDKMEIHLARDAKLPILFPSDPVDIGQCRGTCVHAQHMGQVNASITAHSVVLNRLGKTRNAACVPHRMKTLSVMLIHRYKEKPYPIEFTNFEEIVVASCRCA